MSQSLQPTSGKAWRTPREEGFLITLLSGHVARLRPVALDVLILSGKVPDLLTAIAAKTLWAEQDVSSIADQAELAVGYAELVNLVCRASFLEPRIVDQPEGDDEIALDDIGFEDKVQVFQLAIQPAEVLRGFCDKQGTDVAALPDGEGDGDAAERPADS